MTCNIKKMWLALVLGFATNIQAQNVEIKTGAFEPSWESAAALQCPEWFQDAKFGIWAHRGPQCQAEDCTAINLGFCKYAGEYEDWDWMMINGIELWRKVENERGLVYASLDFLLFGAVCSHFYLDWLIIRKILSKFAS